MRPGVLLRLCALLLSLGARPLAGQADPVVVSRVEAWYREARRIAPGTWGIAIADQQGHLVWSQNPTEPMIPASTVKLLTTGFARTVVGGDARIATRVVGTGDVLVATGEWIGDWSLELNGDVTLERGPGEGPTLRELAHQLRAAGVRRLRGPLTISSERESPEAVYPATWSPRHRGRYFAPLVGPTMLHENIVAVTVAPGAKSGARAVLTGVSPSPVTSLVSVRAVTRNGRRTRLSLAARADGGWVVNGSIGRGARARTLVATVRDPAKVVEAVWASALEDAGIEWAREARPAKAPPGSERTVLAEVHSTIFDSVASEVNRRSLNSGAELLLQWGAGQKDAGERLTAHVAAVTGIAEGLRLVDGSGLSDDNRITPWHFIAYLSRFPATPAGRGFPLLLPPNGAGTLHKLAAGLPASGVVRAKTGTLSQVANVVGYLGRPSGVLLVALLYNGPRPWAARQAEWRLFRLLGADGIVVPADTSALDDVQLGSDDPSAEPADTSAADGDSGGGGE